MSPSAPPARRCPPSYLHVHRLREELLIGDGDERARWFIQTLLSGMTDSPG
ncbi:MAG: hypothetical protein ACR2G2_19880 [Pseudonocardia sp.]